MDMDSSQNDMTDMSESHNDDNLHSESESENTDLNASAASNRSRSNEQYVINSNVTFVSDNASDICKALRVYGQVQWFGCFGHHLNLVVRVAFKTILAAAKLLRKCKMIVCSVNQSTPILYNVRRYQNELDIPVSAIMQKMATRWWV